MMKAIVGVVGLLCVSTIASAQPATSYTLVLQTTAVPPVIVSTTVVPAASFLCGQTPLPGTNTINPQHVEFVDPSNPVLACIYGPDPATGPLNSLPFGAQAYQGTLAATNAAGTSAASALSNSFTHPGAVPGV